MKKKNRRNYNIKHKNSQSGNVLMIVLIGVVLFAALSFTVSSSMQDDGTVKMTARELKIAAADVISFAQKVERAVNKLRRHNISETDISFEFVNMPGYTNANCSDGNCKVFNIVGGSISWLKPQENINDGSLWLINANNTILGQGCDDPNDLCTDLALFLPNLTFDMCVALNYEQGIDLNVPPDDADNNFDITSKFTGDFTYNASISDTGGILNGVNAGCIEGSSNTYHFYYVLIAR